MTSVRVLIVAMPPMLSGLVRGLTAGHPALEIVAELERAAELPNATKEYRPDVIMTSALDLRPSLGELLRQHPGLRVLTVTEDGRMAYLYRMVPQRIAIEDISPQELIDAILGSGRYAPGGIA